MDREREELQGEPVAGRRGKGWKDDGFISMMMMMGFERRERRNEGHGKRKDGPCEGCEVVSSREMWDGGCAWKRP